MGSLTTPLCNEVVVWTVFKVSRKLLKPSDNNTHFLQKLKLKTKKGCKIASQTLLVTFPMRLTAALTLSNKILLH